MAKEYINPLTDTGFKLIFGTPEHKILLIDFLNCLLKGERTITDITYMDKEQISDEMDGRGVIYDIFCKTDTGEYVVVEMQNQRRENFFNRTVYYASQAICKQGKRGRKWNYKINAVYCIAFMNFTDELLDGKLCSSARLTLDGSGKQLSPLLRFFYIQLPFAKEDNADYVTSLESWTYILKDMNALNLPKYSENKIFNYLKEVTDVASLSPKERARYERDLKRYRDAYTLDKTYEHIIEDSKKAEARGRAAEKLDIALNLKKENYPIEGISKVTGLSIKEIEDIDLN